MSSPEYYCSNGLRFVRPYFHFFQTHVKSRWLGRTLLEVCAEDLHLRPEKIESQVRDGKLYVISNQGRAASTLEIKDWGILKRRKLQRHDLVCHLKHTHEPAVLSNTSNDEPGASTEIVYQDDNILVVNKPCGVPTHPSGSFRYNSMTEILEHELKYKLYPCHRLDKSTSGILIMAKNKEAAASFNQNRITKKTYIARVRGKFPNSDDPIAVVAPIFTLNAAGGYLGQSNANNLALNSKTLFQRLSYNAEQDQSIVSCQPVTGRMHQIRIHLRNMGFPIVNDKHYNYLDYSGSTRDCNNLVLELYRRIKQIHPMINEFKDPEFNIDGTVDVYSATDFYSDVTLRSQISDLQKLKLSELQEEGENDKEFCEECGDYYRNSKQSAEDQKIWLHSLRYKYQGDPDLIFETELPDWYNID
ncbi:tRNA pseudouridine(31) synthase [[Candida] railenensis]|uniref:tRNA pseudouridine(31) synthase n=1 Tax=[Candida] railenensis TaxID=45579 RepID=A0A9P0QT20_9ASCO|nr:tRNA pseudouridine(31) synthase [[Candida] railenensis]